jgi:hypothetical protein
MCYCITYMSLTLYPRMGSRDIPEILDIPPRNPRFSK